ncbi:phosphonate metabolism protein/1,5-bisphosphokinase (PRPP-forming) PhnN [uncultured Tateyamaria sp.]|uniref:phosphonate metabolism protein/1,5-bisphosphokinase (PRPP-forming) PhnN n=1 Tax=uncultured Tateyamaria sp. TaxID=455651 RepID=UPI00261A3A1C|nr:phosphonate metabolism protein/1,5-bisphosphokinase (PRPP-forming) PhnN [uncultured Tateyamaria sp.]
MSGRLIAVVGPSGVGKDTVMEAMVRADPRLGLVRRVITRPSAAGGEAFDGVEPARFEAMRAASAFALHWEAHGLHYGIPASVDADLAAGRDMLANLSRGVLVEAQARFPGLVVIALTADPDVLADRLALRGREDAADIRRRLARAGSGLPKGISAHEIDNSADLTATVSTALAALYPARV